MTHFITLHGHFYQPPRDNPWTGMVDAQPSAAPFHDWNARVTAECYAPNAAARVLDAQGNEIARHNNYARMSFNFGPTLLSWLDTNEPQTYAAIIAADRDSRNYFGHGSAMAQAYHHCIMPLCNARDKRTQIAWGVADFAHRFGRAPAGLWLPETAVDLESLDLMAQHHIAFTILTPQQISHIRAPNGAWEPVSESGAPWHRPYRIALSHGRSIVAFCYHEPISHAVAFEQILSYAPHFVGRLCAEFDMHGSEPQLMHIATDGETYGHHHTFGDMALAAALRELQHTPNITLTNYAAFLQKFPPTYEARLRENTSWSCAHGVERWRSDCGCQTGGEAGWNQAWRAPLRDALDDLRDLLSVPFERAAGKLLRDPWDARNDYIRCVLTPDATTHAQFLAQHTTHSLTADESAHVFALLELQHNAMRMFTSCGWFFSDVAGIETIQLLRYAGRAIELARTQMHLYLEPDFLQRLEKIHSNRADHISAAELYWEWVPQNGTCLA